MEVLASAREAGDAEAEATALRARGLARREQGDLVGARRLLESAVDASGARAGGLARGSLASVLAASGELDAALEHLDVARGALVEAIDRAPVEMQRGDVLLRLGRSADALAAFDGALAVAVESGDGRTESLTRINRGILLGYAGRFDEADEDLRIAEDALRARGLHLLAADCRHNRGFVAGRRGDVVAALRFFEEARHQHERLGVERPSAWMDECEVLLAVRLAPEARSLAAAAEAAMVRTGQGADAAEVQLLLARACELDGDLDAAGGAAARAIDGFAAQGRESWEALATLVRLRVAAASGSEASSATATDLADRLASSGAVEQEVEARLLAAQLSGDDETAIDQLVRASDRGRGDRSAATNVMGWTAEALLRRRRGDVRGALDAAARGVAIVADAAVALGARELRTGILAHADEVAQLGLALAVEGGRVPTILRWAEAARTSVVARRGVRPPADAQLHADLAALREASREVEDATLEGDVTADAVARRDELERRVVRRARLLRGSRDAGSVAALPSIRIGALRERLGERSLLVLVEVAGRLVGVHVGRRISRVVELGPVGEVDAVVDALRFAVGRASDPGGRRSSVEAARSTAALASVDLAELVLAPFALGDGGLVLVPTPGLSGVPWGVLPPLRGRPFAVAPSVLSWLGADEHRAVGRGAVVVIGGPDVPGVEAEVSAVAACHREAQTLVGGAATVDAALSALAGPTRIAHVAAHGRFRADSPLFSSLLLHDGPLSVHDLDAIGAAPDLVFLSACDVGRSEVVTAFLELGTSTLIASVLPVAHDLAAGVAVAFHAALAGGAGPAEALAVATASEDRWTPFIAFGSG